MNPIQAAKDYINNPARDLPLEDLAIIENLIRYADPCLPAKHPSVDDYFGVEDAIRDALSGWNYIRENHGDLYGLGWERVENKLWRALDDIPKSYEDGGPHPLEGGGL